MKNREYSLNEIFVDPRDLVLDPNNPRLLNGMPQKQYADAEIISDKTQNYLRDKLREKEHGVKKLIDSIANNGFINIDSIFVKRLKGTGKFLVIEGNRRTTAINFILNNPKSISESALKSLKEIPAKELICEDAKTHEEMTAFILSIRHLGGIKNWAPIQQAFTIYDFYMREFTAKFSHGFLENAVFPFCLDSKVLEYVSNTLSLSQDNVKKALRIYVVFNQLKKSHYKVENGHYTLLDLAVNTYPLLRTKFFEVNENSFLMSNRGLENFNTLCIEEGCKINNPTAFRNFYHIFKDGKESDVKLVLEGEDDISEIKKRLTSKINFCKQLEDIKKKLGSLVVTDYRNSPEEKKLILEIKQMVDLKLIRLTK
jgi:hypothetical protein